MADADERRLSAASGMVAMSILWHDGATETEVKSVFTFALEEWRRRQAPTPKTAEPLFR